MSASIHRHTCQQLGVCQDRTPPCSKTCARPEQEDKPIATPEACESACMAVLVIIAVLAAVAAVHLWARYAA